ncbi:MAG: NAD-dependent epimerase/dehydratase family protein [Candidatus Omnitrophota bacterium]
MKKKTVLITGINGFIGSSLKEVINKKYPSWNIYGIDRLGNKSNTIFKINVTNKSKLAGIISKEKPDYIFHLAGSTCRDNLKELLRENVVSTFTILEAVKSMDNYNPRIVIPSSAAEYGERQLNNNKFKESYPEKPVTLYGLSKAMQSRLSLLYASGGLNVVVARIFNIFGKGTPVSLSIGRFSRVLALIKKGKVPAVINTKSLDSKRDFLDIYDVCRYLLAVAIFGEKGQVYNICRGKSYKMRYLLRKLINLSGIRNIKVIEDKKDCKENALDDFVGSSCKINKIIKSNGLISIEQSLRESYRYYLSRI